MNLVRFVTFQEIAGNATALVTFRFEADGRTAHEIKEMKEYGYVEVADFQPSVVAGNTLVETPLGYFCGSCGAFESRPHTMPQAPCLTDGFCRKFSFRDRAYGCCDGWFMKG